MSLNHVEFRKCNLKPLVMTMERPTSLICSNLRGAKMCSLKLVPFSKLLAAKGKQNLLAFMEPLGSRNGMSKQRAKEQCALLILHYVAILVRAYLWFVPVSKDMDLTRFDILVLT